MISFDWLYILLIIHYKCFRKIKQSFSLVLLANKHKIGEKNVYKRFVMNEIKGGYYEISERYLKKKCIAPTCNRRWLGTVYKIICNENIKVNV